MVEDDEDMMLSCKKAKRMMEEKSVLVQFRWDFLERDKENSYRRKLQYSSEDSTLRWAQTRELCT